MENGEMLVFNHVEKYFEDNDTFFEHLVSEIWQIRH